MYFIVYFKTALTPDKGLENLRVAISSNGTLGDFQAKDLVVFSEERTKSTTTTGRKGLGSLSINVIRLRVFSRSHFHPLFLFYSSFPCLASFPSTSFCHIFLLSYVCQLFAKVCSKVLHFIETVII